jgi:hypothetical protein
LRRVDPSAAERAQHFFPIPKLHATLQKSRFIERAGHDGAAAAQGCASLLQHDTPVSPTGLQKNPGQLDTLRRASIGDQLDQKIYRFAPVIQPIRAIRRHAEDRRTG